MGKGVRLYDPKTSRDYKAYVARIAQGHAPKEPIETTLSVNLVIYRQIPKSTSKKKREKMLSGEIRPTVKPDIDNLSKSILDACNGIIYKDDSQIVGLNATKYYSDSPGAEIEIREEWEWNFNSKI